MSFFKKIFEAPCSRLREQGVRPDGNADGKEVGHHSLPLCWGRHSADSRFRSTATPLCRRAGEALSGLRGGGVAMTTEGQGEGHGEGRGDGIGDAVLEEEADLAGGTQEEEEVGGRS